MIKDSICLTITYDGQFWIGIFEKTNSKELQACKIVFGSEPTDAEIFEVLKNKQKALSFSPPIKNETQDKKLNPKKTKKLIIKNMQQKMIGTKSQQAIKLQIEQRKVENKKLKKENQEADKIKKYQQKQQKKKDKHSGH